MAGIIGKKLGMTQIFDENAQARPVTVISSPPPGPRNPSCAAMLRAVSAWSPVIIFT